MPFEETCDEDGCSQLNTFRKLSSLDRSGLLPEKMVSGEKSNM